MTRRARPIHLLLLVVVCASAVARADEPLQIGVRAGGHYTDNVNRTATDEISSTGVSGGLAIGGQDITGPLQYSMFGDVNYQKLENATTGEEVRGRAAGTGSYEFLPETFAWTVAGLFTQMRADLQQGDTVENREDVLTLGTGPSFTGYVSDAFAVKANARYTQSDYSKRDMDNSSVGGELLFGRVQPRAGFLGVGAGYIDVSFDNHTDPEAVDYARREAFVRAQLRGVRTTLSLDAGYARVESDDQEADGPVVRLDLTRPLGSYLSGSLTYSRSFAITQDSDLRPTTNVEPDESLLTAGPREVETVGAYFSFRKQRTSLDFGYYHSDEEAQLGLIGERETNQARLRMSRWLTARSELQLFGVWSDENLKTRDLRSNEVLFGMQLDLAFGRKLGLLALVEHRDRESDLPVSTFKELAVGLYLRYGRVDPSIAEGGATAPLAP